MLSAAGSADLARPSIAGGGAYLGGRLLDRVGVRDRGQLVTCLLAVGRDVADKVIDVQVAADHRAGRAGRGDGDVDGAGLARVEDQWRERRRRVDGLLPEVTAG